MKDSMGHVLKNGDIVLCVANHNFGEIGCMINNGIRVLSDITRAKSTGYTYLIANPTSEEYDAATVITNAYNNYLSRKESKKKSKKEYGKLIGGVYSTVNGEQFLYLGKLHVVDFDKGKMVFEKKGHVYINILNRDRIIYGLDISDLDGEELLASYRDSISVLKNYKVVDGFLGIHPMFKYSDFRNVLGKHKAFFGNRWTGKALSPYYGERVFDTI